MEAERERLRRLTWMALQREALEAGVPLGAVRKAPTREALWLAILALRFPESVQNGRMIAVEGSSDLRQ